ncbi:MAG TPA: bifunctional homocysteine S-methyltransferase/methylenetetrahydrofolate reductase [Gemmatimonadota bacterium]|nr:bifunctional homocysteine S-methyltransferase/methylenetetrahydrofolate reductase [Gemmatimonadota bacterium]
MITPVRASARRGALLIDRLHDTVVVADGAMGTALYERGVFINQSFDALCLTRPELVAEVHRQYRSAGAELLETNTFGANRSRLAGHGLENQVREINAAAVRLAREAAGDEAWVGGSMGPVGVAGQVAGQFSAEDLERIFGEQAEALLEAGVDVFVVETIPWLVEMEAALAAIRRLDSAVPVIAMMTFNEDGETQGGETPEIVVERLNAAGADVIGANCSVGPKPMLDVIARMTRPDVLLAAMPNAGLPQSVEGRLLYMASAEYFGKYARRFVKAGVRLLGGCCGTTPEHVRRMKRAVAGFAPDRQSSRSEGEGAVVQSPPRTVLHPEERTPLARRLSEPGAFVTSIELTPPKSAALGELVDSVRALAAAGVDAVNIPEYARISPRPTPLAIARAIRDAIPDMETIIHYCCRDRNLYGMQADLLSAHALDVRNVLIITGDPPKAGEYAIPTAVFDVDSIGLTRVATGLDRGMDAAGRETGIPLSLHIGVGVNPGAIDVHREIDRFRRKLEAGAEFAMTQPVYDPLLLESFLDELGDPRIPILVGILPLHSYRNAEFLHNEVPGMRIPEAVRERMRAADGQRAARAEGIAIARDALEGVRGLPGVRGVYVMPPFGRYEIALEVLGL